MAPSAPPSVVAAFTALTSTNPSHRPTGTPARADQPLVTFYDDRTGERTELSGATMANWVAKTANLLVDGLGLGPGAVAAIRLPAHWQTAAVLLGSWSAGLRISYTAERADVAFVTADQVGAVSADETYALALAPLAGQFRPGPPTGSLDYVLEVRGYGDRFVPVADVSGRDLAVDQVTHGELVGAALSRVAGDRVLIDADRTPDPLDWLVAPLMAGGSTVLCAHLDPARLQARLRSERATLLDPGAG